MATQPIETTNLPWQLRNAGKNLSEWIQLRLAGNEEETNNVPTSWDIPEWIAQVLFWLLAMAGIVLLAWVIVQLLDQFLARRSRRQNRQPLVQPLPQETQHSVAEWLRLAKQHEQAGNWREACRALYMAALQLLHDRGWIPHQPGRTDGEYWHEVQALKQPRPWQLLIRTHERSLFGGEVLTAENLQRCRRAYEEVAKP